MNFSHFESFLLPSNSIIYSLWGNYGNYKILTIIKNETKGGVVRLKKRLIYRVEIRRVVELNIT